MTRQVRPGTKTNVVTYITTLQKHMREENLKLTCGNSFITFGDQMMTDEDGVEYIQLNKDDLGIYIWVSAYEVDVLNNCIYFKKEGSDFKCNGIKCWFVKDVELPKWAD